MVVDYPTRRSVNALSGPLFGLKQGVEGDTRPFTVFSDGEIEAAFGAHGFRPAARRPQFFLPMALYRALRLGGSRARQRRRGAGARPDAGLRLAGRAEARAPWLSRARRASGRSPFTGARC